MKSFVVIFVLKPAVKIDKKFNAMDFTFNEPTGTKRVFIHKIEEPIGGLSVQTGLVFRVYLEAINVGEARNQAKGFVDRVVGFISFATGIGLRIPSEVLAYEITPETKEKEFLQIFWNPSNTNLSRRTVNTDFLMRVINSAITKGNPSYHCIARSIRWHRMSALTADVFDKFNCFWIGLESLNLLLQQTFGITTATKDVSCEKCGYQWSIRDETTAGIKYLIKEKMADPALYRRLRKLRVDLMHSTCELGKIAEEAKQLTPKLGEILFRAVCLLLGLADWSTLEYREPLETVPLRLEIEAKIVGQFDSTFGFDGKDPHVEGQFNLVKIEEKEDGTYSITNQSNFTHKLPPSQSLQVLAMTMFGDKELIGNSIDIKLKKKDEP